MCEFFSESLKSPEVNHLSFTTIITTNDNSEFLDNWNRKSLIGNGKCNSTSAICYPTSAIEAIAYLNLTAKDCIRI